MVFPEEVHLKSLRVYLQNVRARQFDGRKGPSPVAVATFCPKNAGRAEGMPSSRLLVVFCTHARLCTVLSAAQSTLTTFSCMVHEVPPELPAAHEP